MRFYNCNNCGNHQHDKAENCKRPENCVKPFVYACRITYAKNSIGAEILDAKNVLEGAEMFAWTLTVVLLSLLLEFSVKKLLRRVKGI